jgi:hypothetical protein
MVAFVTEAVIFTSSIVLFGYWFRYACMLILATKTAQDYSEAVAATNQLDFREVRVILQQRFEVNLDILHRSLERDYAIVTYLLAHTPEARDERHLEAVMIRLHYRAMSIWFLLTRRFLRETASRALDEMSLVVVHLAHAIGERTSLEYKQALTTY